MLTRYIEKVALHSILEYSGGNRISIMIHTFLPFFAISFIASVTCLPSDRIGSNSLEVAENSNFQWDLKRSDSIECTSDASTTDLSDDTVGGSDQDGSNLVKRQGAACSVPGLGRSSRGKKFQTNPSPNSSNQPTKTEDAEPGCNDPAKLVLLSCSGPEVWNLGVIDLVLNCVTGKLFPPVSSNLNQNR